MRWLVVVLALGAGAAAQVAGTVSTCVRGEVRPAQRIEVHLFRGESARQVREAIVALEHVDASEEAHQGAYDRLRQAVREQRGTKTRSDRQGRFRFEGSGELVIAMDHRSRRFDFAFLREPRGIDLWIADVARDECRRPAD